MTKIYTATVFDGENQILLDAKGKLGLQELVESRGLFYGGVQRIYAQKEIANQVHLEWSEVGAWTQPGLVRKHVFQKTN